ncbi:FAD-dependent oxidoreductase [Arthrobacter sp. SW1]|uniref:GMC oxidoreductase n=1 Tax=Arthrobacter sp. SW1 TaxID=1920889 RepID=UPI000877C7D6|nr:GMC oxidoreductase [Arthrobacter sp. SW1]OFI38931.1 FAD-dependent oxidoreductase [Arthrobacter sp. SW1]
MTQPGKIQQEIVDAVVVGSGFGGSVAALRLAEAGKSVVLMERGKPYPPGSFARTPAEMGRNFWDPDRGLYGLFDAWTFRGMEGLVSSGLGGGSLIYANVLLRKDPKWFVKESPVPGGGYENWPFDYDDLEPFYKDAEDMLRPVPYPYQDTAKTAAMEAAAEALGLSITRPPIAVTFTTGPGADPGSNQPLQPAPYGSIHGSRAVRTTCTLCGECDLGCNSGAKNTLDHNYLSAAKKAGADIRTLHDVRGIRPLGSPGSSDAGYEVRYVVHDPQNPGGLLRERIIRCRHLVLGAGTFGSNFLLLRNRASLPGLSDALGSRFSGNGDLLTLVMNAKIRNGSPVPAVRTLTGSRGPVITTAIRVPDTADGGSGRGYYVEDAGYPAFMNWLIETGQLGKVARRTARVAVQLLKDRLFEARRSNISADLAAALGDGSLSASSLPLLGMGRDIPDGVLSLQDGRLAVDWTLATSKNYFGRMRKTMEEIAGELGGDFVDNPLWWAKRVITVHPIGGAPAGRSPSEGVCDSYGEVFGYPGMFVVDGAAMPGPVGANPSLTIAAFAERACRRLLEGTRPGTRSLMPTALAPSAVVDSPAESLRELAPDATKGNAAKPERPAKPATAARGLGAPETANADATSVSFTEQMHGWFSPGTAEPAKGHSLGRDRDRRIMFELTITAPDIDAFVADPLHRATAEGYVLADQFGGRMPVEKGWFKQFVADASPDARPARRMLYRLWLRDPGGTPLTFTGFKVIHNDAGLDSWADTTTLYATIVRGHVPPPELSPEAALPPSAEWAPPEPASVAGSGILRIRPLDFAKQLTTFRAKGPDPLPALAAFGNFFLGELWRVYGKTTAKPRP